MDRSRRVPVPHYSAEEAREMDRWLLSRGFTLEQLMDWAGRRVAEAARELIAERDLRRVVFLVGPGNNGGDALVAARLLAEDAQQAPLFERDAARPVVATEIVRPLEGDEMPHLDAHTLVVDGLFGVGLSRPVAGRARDAVEAVNGSAATVLAIDVPSGLSADSGQIVGVSEARPHGGVAVCADRTVTFVGPKRGFFAGRGPELVGEWEAVEIGFPAEEAHEWLRRRRAGGAGGAGPAPGGGADRTPP